MTIRRVAVLIAFLILGALAASGQVVLWQGAASPSQPLPPSSGCTLPSSAPSSDTCITYNVPITAIQFTVLSPPSGTPTWSLGSGSLPAGLQLDPAAGDITGTPTAGGVYSFTVTATYSVNQVFTSQPYTIAISSGTLAVQQVPLPTNAVAFTSVGPAWYTASASGGYPFINSGGNPYYQWSFATGSQPDGLVIDPNTGIISGTPAAAGTFSVIIQAADAFGQKATYSASLTVSAPSGFTITTTSLPNGSVGTAYNQTLQQSGGPSSGVTWSWIGNPTLPPGLNISSNTNSTGTISGTPTAAGTYPITVQASFQSGSTTVTVAQALSIVIAPSGFIITTTSLPNGTIGTAYNQTLQESGGPSSGVTWSWTGNPTLPPGLNISSNANSTGTISGTPTAAGTYNFTVQASYQSGTTTLTATQALSIVIIPSALTMASPAAVSGFVGQTLSPWMQFTATGGSAPYTYAFVGGSLPPGLTLNPSTGAITGQATQPCSTCAFQIQVTDSSTPAPLTAYATSSITTTYISITGATITPNGTLSAATQPAVTVTLGTAVPAGVQPISVTLTVSFVRNFDGQASREVLFSNGAPTIQFTLAAGSTQAIPVGGGSVALIVGTAAGHGTITVTFQDALYNTLTVQPVNFSVVGTAPVIKSFTISPPSGNTYTTTIIGYSSTLDMTNAVFNFTPTSGTALAASSVTVPLSSAFLQWYSSSPSNQYGGQFMLTVPFTFSVSGGVSSNPIDAATVTLTNSVAPSATSNPANP